MTKKKEAPKETIKFKNGDYFTAKKDRKNIRGVVNYDANHEEDALILEGLIGDDDTDDYNSNSSFPRCFVLEREEINLNPSSATYKETNYRNETWGEVFKNYGISGFKVVTDRRIKKLIDGDKLVKIGQHKIRVNKDTFVFGCGAVSLERSEIEDVLKIKRILEEYEMDFVELQDLIFTYEDVESQVETHDGSVWEELTVKDIENVLKLK